MGGQQFFAPDRRLVVPLHFFGPKSKISRFGERFRDGQYSVVTFLFAVLLLTVPYASLACDMTSASEVAVAA